MTAVRIYVGTTEGPAEIQRLTEESPEIRSVVCLDGKAVALSISADYDSFVRRPTGIVERLFGHSGYRMDVGARITDGLSWQLGALLAHALHADGRLATVGAPTDAVVWATGEVDAALQVRSVDAVPRKLRTSVELLRGLAARRTPMLVMVSGENEADARSVLREASLEQSCRLVAVTSAADAFAALDLTPDGKRPARLVVEPPRPWRRRRWVRRIGFAVVLGLALAAAGLAVAWRDPVVAWTRLAEAGNLPELMGTLAAIDAAPHCLTCWMVVALFRERLAAERPLSSGIRVEAVELRGVQFGGCGNGATTDASARLKSVAVARQPDGGFVPSHAVGLCAIRYSVSGAPHVALIVSNDRIVNRQPGNAVAVGSGAVQLQAAVPHWLASPIENRVLVLAAPVPLESLLAEITEQSSAAEPLSPATLSQLTGISVLAFEVRHSIVPQ